MIPESERKALLREQAKSSRGAEFTCASPSMEPTIAVGHRVRAYWKDISALRVGEVVVFEGKNSYVLHRIVAFGPRRRWFLHLGDAPTAAGPRRAMTSSIVGWVPLPRKFSSPLSFVFALRRISRKKLS